MLGTGKRCFWLVVVVAVFAMYGMPAFAISTFQFTVISSNDPSQTAGDVGTEAFLLEVSKPFADSEQTLFTFRVLSGSYAYTDFFVDGVYFYDGALLGIADLIENPAEEVDFTEGATPGHLPGIDLGSHKLVAGYELDTLSLLGSADADPNPAINGIGIGESLGVLFDLQPGQTYEDVVAGIINKTIMVGIKAQGFGPYSETFVAVPVPAPAALVLGALGAGAVGLLRRRKVL